jgi:hypothetical protein
MCDTNEKVAELLQRIVSQMRDDLNRLEICIEALNGFGKKVPFYESCTLPVSSFKPREERS